MNCLDCKYSCPREKHSLYGISADCDLVCYYDVKQEMYVNKTMYCKHFSSEGKIDWNTRRKREYPIIGEGE